MKFTVLHRYVLAALAILFSTTALAAALPHEDGQIHEGVATCAGSQCHGATTAKADSNVLQNEYYLWSREDRHAQAYKTLLTEESKTMGRRLGITPHTDKQCLVCHSDYVPEAMRGKRFRLSDGVGCEACHGGSENWLVSHVEKGATHADNLKAGLYPSDNPQARAKMCLTCHLGGPDHPIDHRIMGAGHPPLGFELDTFTAIQPAHYAMDADYAQRKGIRPPVEVWATGQMISALRYLEELASPRLQNGLFPELVFFDCYACHHELSAARWDAETAPGLGVGAVRLHGVNLLLVGQILEVTDAAAGKRWDAAVRELHVASQASIAATQARAKAATALLRELASAHAGRQYSTAEIWSLFGNVLDKARRMPDFNYAEQSNMALEALYLTLADAGEIPAARSKRIRAALDKGYEFTNAAEQYRVDGYRAVLNDIRGQLPKR